MVCLYDLSATSQLVSAVVVLELTINDYSVTNSNLVCISELSAVEVEAVKAVELISCSGTVCRNVEASVAILVSINLCDT